MAGRPFQKGFKLQTFRCWSYINISPPFIFGYSLYIRIFAKLKTDIKCHHAQEFNRSCLTFWRDTAWKLHFNSGLATFMGKSRRSRRWAKEVLKLKANSRLQNHAKSSNRACIFQSWIKGIRIRLNTVDILGYHTAYGDVWQVVHCLCWYHCSPPKQRPLSLSSAKKFRDSLEVMWLHLLLWLKWWGWLCIVISA